MSSASDVVELSAEEIALRVEAMKASSAASRGGGETGSTPLATETEVRILPAPTSYRFVRPLTQAADSLIQYIQNVDGRFMFGLPELDMKTRGIGRGELAYLTGYSTSGKTQLVLTGMVNNRDQRIVLVTMDETAEQVLTKLVCMLTGSNAERLEDRVKAGDQAAIDRVRKIAAVDFANLVVVDGGMRLEELSTVVQEAESHFDGPIDLLVLDYLDLLKTEDSNTEQKSQSLKAWVTSQPFPVVCIHQGSRGNSGGGQKLSMNSMKYAGEAEATFVIGVRRLRDDPDMEGVPGVEDTVEVHLIKNKRPPSRVGEHTYYMKPESGLILPLDQMPRRH